MKRKAIRLLINALAFYRCLTFQTKVNLLVLPAMCYLSWSTSQNSLRAREMLREAVADYHNAQAMYKRVVKAAHGVPCEGEIAAR